MRGSLALVVGSVLFAAACNGGSSGTTGTSGGITSNGGASSGNNGTTTGAGTTTGNLTTGGSTTGTAPLAAGAPCSSNEACLSGICGVNGSGKCCTGPTACVTSDATCGATGCDDTGACMYPATGTACGSVSCSGATLTPSGTCNGQGICSPGTGAACPNDFGCADGGVCATSCSSSADCATSFSCNAGACVPPIGTGPCTENDDCTSGVCGTGSDAGTGNCCGAACAATADPACTAIACDATGACVYPAGDVCGNASCTKSKEISGACDENGACKPSSTPCPSGFGCNAAGTLCNTSCAATADCASGDFCIVDGGFCAAQQAIGPCTENDACTSGVCGIAGIGNCCIAACTNLGAPCGATDCVIDSGVCNYAGSSVLCGTVAETCTGSTQQNPSACDGTGVCDLTPGTTDCSPYVCGASSCLSTCTDGTSCGTSDFCDTSDSACCSLSAGGTISVDATNGSDATGCCGIGKAGPCQTITHAMQLIDEAGAKNVTINAAIAGAGGDWKAKETYPIVLGWGAELSAPGVYFNDTGSNGEIFDIAFYSQSDTIGYASIVGTAASNVWVGEDTTGTTQTSDSSAIQVEASNTLYIANALATGNVTSGNAITVVAGGSLTLAEDQSATVTGTVTIGDPNNDGYNGIVCTSANGLGCTITDAQLKNGSSLVIQNQEGVDIDAEDNASISLTSAPTIGVAPVPVGFENCPTKDDCSSLVYSGAILLNGAATVTFKNGTVSCISGDGFVLQAPDGGTPSLTLDKTTIENTELGVYASAGTATITNSTIQYNYNGVEQDSNGTAATTGSISLGGGGNTVICSNSAESAIGLSSLPGVCVLNTTSTTIDASKTTWDTKGPDEFLCNAAMTNCTCEIAACTDVGGADGMDAVYESTGTVTTTGNLLSTASCALPAGNTCTPPCAAPTPMCCPGLNGAPASCVATPMCP